MSATGCVYTSVVDDQYFVGGVALVNSLRLTGNAGDILLLDVGLTPAQRAFLERECEVRRVDLDRGLLAVFSKPCIHRFEKTRTVVILDSDVIVTGSFRPMIEHAEDGKICGFNEPRNRWFSEWTDLFGLRAPLRREDYVSASFLALSTARWGHFLERWEELGVTIREERSKRPLMLHLQDAVMDPTAFSEQDTMNALLMSEVSTSAVVHLDPELAPAWPDRDGVRVADLDAVRCTFAGRESSYLHWTGPVKPWMRWGWSPVSYDAFIRLLPRVLLAEDVPLRLSPSDVPFWLRGTMRSRGTYRALNTISSTTYKALGVLPAETRGRITHTVRTQFSRKARNGAA
ncbi:MAG TPA: hypothetical protein VKA45_05450 [Gaiellaceae bacterium]|nr:hypothetical protein [Gaiellaceae bacterium]